MRDGPHLINCNNYFYYLCYYYYYYYYFYDYTNADDYDDDDADVVEKIHFAPSIFTFARLQCYSVVICLVGTERVRLLPSTRFAQTQAVVNWGPCDEVMTQFGLTPTLVGWTFTPHTA